MKLGEAAIVYERPQALKELFCTDFIEELNALFGGSEAVPPVLSEQIRMNTATWNSVVRLT